MIRDGEDAPGREERFRGGNLENGIRNQKSFRAYLPALKMLDGFPIERYNAPRAYVPMVSAFTTR